MISMPERKPVEVPYVRDQHACRFMAFLARMEALARGEAAPLWVRGVPELDWSRASAEPLMGMGDPQLSHAVSVLSSAAAREAEISLVCRRIMRRIAPIVREEIDAYLHGDRHPEGL